MTDSEREWQSLPAHTTQGWRYRPRFRGWIGAATLFLFLVLFPANQPVALLVLAIGVLLVIPSTNGRTFMYTELVTAWFNARLRGRKGRLGSVRVDHVLYSDDDYLDRIKTSPIEVNFLPMDNVGEEFLTEVYTPDNNRHTLYVLFDSWGNAHINDAEAMLDQTESFGQACRNLAASYGPDLRASMFKFTVPHDPTRELAYFEANRYHPAPDEEGAEHVAWLQEDFKEAIRLQEDFAVDYICGISVTVVRPKEWSRLKPQNLRTANIVASMGYQLTEQLIAYLRTHGAANVRRLDPYESAILFRGTLDPESLPDMYRRWHEDRRRFGTHGFRTLEDSMVLANGAFPKPQEFVVKRDYLRVADRSYHRTFYSPEFTRRRVEVGAMQRLFELSPDLMAGITLTYRTGDPKFEQKVMKYRLNEADVKRYRRETKQKRTRASEEDYEVQLREEDYALYFSGGDTLHLHLLATHPGRELEQLDWRSEGLKRHFTGTTVPMEAVRGEAVEFQVLMEAHGIPSL